MLILISPAKTLDFESAPLTPAYSVPENLEQSEKIIKKLRTVSVKKLGELMSISKDLARLNHERYQQWQTVFTPENSRIAIQAFKGDVYLGLQVESFTPEDLDYANSHLRILSGLHGLLKPLDFIQPYRLEMGTKLPVGRKKNLYQLWTEQVTDRVNEAVAQSGSSYLLNLASDEYFAAVNTEKVEANIIKPSFKEYKNGEYKVLSFFAKKARGLMSAYILKNRINHPEDIKNFAEEDYTYNPDLSNHTEWVFTRNREN
ncbi:peroxide stress protein YaaA [bacterium]|nr:peroxide stress protein YaaA [bacterium]